MKYYYNEEVRQQAKWIIVGCTMAIALILLAACNEASAPEPYWGCTKQSEPYLCGRGGSYCYTCLERGITCPKPTELKQVMDKLVCRMPETQAR